MKKSLILLGVILALNFTANFCHADVTWGDDVRLTYNARVWPFFPSIATDSQNRIHVVREDYLIGEISYKRSLDGGITWEADVRLDNDNINSYKPSIATDSQSRVYVVWVDYRDGPLSEIYYKRGIQGCGHSSSRSLAALAQFSDQEINEEPLDNFDVRVSDTVASAVKPLDSRIQAVERLKGQLGERVKMTWNPFNGTPRSLTNYDGYLSASSSEPPLDIALEFFKKHEDLFGLSNEDLASFEEASYQTKQNGVTHVSLTQKYQGLPIFGAQLKINVDKDGRILSLGGDYFPGIDISIVPKLSVTEAFLKAMQDVAPDVNFQPEIISADPGPTQATVFHKGPFKSTDAFHAASLTVFPMQEEFRLVWQVILHKNSVERYIILIDANTGELLYRSNLVEFDQPQGLVFEEDPDDGSQVMMSFEGDPVASPSGWLYQNQDTYSSLGGNNTCTQEDRDDNDSPGYSPSDVDGHFEYPFQDAYETSGGMDVNTDLDAALTNLFYQVNTIHDYFYSLGFDETAGNFQSDNFSQGGLGNDEVHADAQDAWDTGARNNANFYTPVDGYDPIFGKPRIQMYLFTRPPYRDADGDFDGKVIVHEYTHGLSNRLVGGANNVMALNGIQSGAMGEGWGDWFASSIYDDSVVGEYVTGDPTSGIRRYPLDDNPLTYADLCNGPRGCGVHADGEIWSVFLWDLRKEFIDKYGFNSGKEQVEQIVVDGMKFSPASPSMLDMRDAILSADQAIGGFNQNIIWQAFACRGMGDSAFTIDHNDRNPVEAFDFPGGGTCVSPYTADLSLDMLDTPDPVKVDEPLMYTATVDNNGPDNAWDVTFTTILPGSVTFISILPSQGTCAGTTTITCYLGEIEKNDSATVTIIVKPILVGTIDNVASVTGWVVDPDQTNNSVTVTTTVKEKSCLGTGSFRLGGTVKDEAEVGIPGVTMTLNGPDNCMDSTITVPRGYAFVGLGEGVYTATPTKTNCDFEPISLTKTVNKRNNLARFRGACAE